MTVSITKPVVGGSTGSWGTLINAALDTLTSAANTTATALTPTAVKTTNYTAAANEIVPVDTTSAPVTVTLPTAPADGTRVTVKHVVQGGTNTVTVSRGGSSDVFNKTGGSTSLTLTYLNQAVTVQYTASSGIWYVVSDDIPLAAVSSAVLPSQTGQAGKVLGTDGATASWTAAGSGAVASVAGKTGAVTLVKADVGLGNVDNTSDVNKPVSTAQAAAIAPFAPDLTDRTNSTTETVPVGTRTHCTTAGVTKTGPALAGTVGAPPLRWAVRNGSTGTITLSYPATDGTATTLTMLPGEVLTFRQLTTLGWAAEGGNKTLSSLDGRYAQLTNNLSDLASAATARTNLGLGTAATQASTAFDAAGAAAAVLPTQTGNAGKLLTTDGSAASWANPVSPTIYKNKAGTWTAPAGMTAIAGSAMTSARRNVLEFVPIDVPLSKTFDRISCHVTALSSGGDPVLRLGIYSDDGTGQQPSTLLLDAGTQAPTSFGAGNAVTISWTSPSRGRFWVAKVLQYTTVPTTFPTLQIVNGGALLPSANLNDLTRGWSIGTAVSGALPSSVTSETFTGLATPDIAGLRAA